MEPPKQSSPGTGSAEGSVTTLVGRLFNRVPAIRFWTEVRSIPPVSPILSRQLQESCTDMEHGVSRVCASFETMATRASETVRSAGQILSSGGDSGHSVDSAFRACSDEMHSLLERLERGSALTARAITRMEQVEKAVGRVGKVLDQLEQSAFSSRIVALNAKIEAVHLGEAGRGFEVVAEEVSGQADRCTNLTSEVAEILNELVNGARETANELRSLASADRDWVESAREEIRRVMGALEQTDRSLRASLTVASEQSEELATAIRDAQVTLQFQDRVNQRIQHVIESLNAMSAAISGSAGSTVAGAPAAAHSHRLASSYTMACEREAHFAGRSDAAREDDIELF